MLTLQYKYTYAWSKCDASSAGLRDGVGLGGWACAGGSSAVQHWQTTSLDVTPSWGMKQNCSFRVWIYYIPSILIVVVVCIGLLTSTNWSMMACSHAVCFCLIFLEGGSGQSGLGHQRDRKRFWVHSSYMHIILFEEDTLCYFKFSLLKLKE